MGSNGVRKRSEFAPQPIYMQEQQDTSISAGSSTTAAKNKREPPIQTSSKVTFSRLQLDASKTVSDTIPLLLKRQGIPKSCLKHYSLYLIISSVISQSKTATSDKSVKPIKIRLGLEAFPLHISTNLNTLGLIAVFILRKAAPEPDSYLARIPPSKARLSYAESRPKSVHFAHRDLERFRFLITVHVPRREQYHREQCANGYHYGCGTMNLELPPSPDFPFRVIKGLMSLGLRPKFQVTKRSEEPFNQLPHLRNNEEFWMYQQSLQVNGAFKLDRLQTELRELGEREKHGSALSLEEKARLEEIPVEIEAVYTEWKRITKQAEEWTGRGPAGNISFYVAPQALHCEDCSKKPEKNMVYAQVS
ncbi:hypothetical protein BJ508DRAFT_415988 [Ascobolus immersus RN42]|uniref:Uncharacterized protein n=1 Tax=Ascobolus immersus RN42 TaxID=1160509 RepID=A0A3N4I1T7_ASCIM|nr:hypothetical protein BJ508DRAFT_415988 [Ascobolus immersus RN42]